MSKAFHSQLATGNKCIFSSARTCKNAVRGYLDLGGFCRSEDKRTGGRTQLATVDGGFSCTNACWYVIRENKIHTFTHPNTQANIYIYKKKLTFKQQKPSCCFFFLQNILQHTTFIPWQNIPNIQHCIYKLDTLNLEFILCIYSIYVRTVQPQQRAQNDLGARLPLTTNLPGRHTSQSTKLRIKM